MRRMRFIIRNTLTTYAHYADEFDILLIFDEIAQDLGAPESSCPQTHNSVQTFMCVGKALTGGVYDTRRQTLTNNKVALG